jgi:hypothetical protein
MCGRRALVLTLAQATAEGHTEAESGTLLSDRRLPAPINSQIHNFACRL